MTSRPTLSDMAEMIQAKRLPVWELDQAFWACERGVEFPLTHYDLETWEESRREGAPAATLVSDAGALTRYIEECWPDHRIDMRFEKGHARIEVMILGLGIGASSTFTGKLPLSELNRGLSIAFSGAHQVALDLQQRLYAVAGLAETAPPIRDWPIEEISPGRFAPVLHDLNLAGAVWGARETAEKNSGLNHKGDYGMMLCRKRYEENFAGREPEEESPAP